MQSRLGSKTPVLVVNRCQTRVERLRVRAVNKPCGPGDIQSQCSEAFYCCQCLSTCWVPEYHSFRGSSDVPRALYLVNHCITPPFPARLGLWGRGCVCGPRCNPSARPPAASIKNWRKGDKAGRTEGEWWTRGPQTGW